MLGAFAVKLNDSRKLDIASRELVSQGILSDEPGSLKDYLLQVVEVSSDEAGRIYLELGTLRGNFMDDVILAMMDFLPDMARKMKSKPAELRRIIYQNNKKMLIHITQKTRDFHHRWENFCTLTAL